LIINTYEFINYNIVDEECKNTDDWFDDTVEVKRDTIKSASPFTRVFQQIMDDTKIDSDDSLMANYLFNIDLILFLYENFILLFVSSKNI
jgi:hypothetical protein